ncbi:MAG: cytochrome C [Proteobacteria bacterium]|nr:cytochrome C [Pseudomonadota bacterium]
MKVLTFGTAVIGLAAVLVQAAAQAQSTPIGNDATTARGRYLVQIGGCNDCHTPGYGMANGQVPESQWLVGDSVGWQGPWGTTYATNLRRWMGQRTEAQWIAYARTMKPRPPMPWFNVRVMSDEDLAAIYRFTTSLGPAGAEAPAYVPPGKEAKGPVIRFPG